MNEQTSKQKVTGVAFLNVECTCWAWRIKGEQEWHLPDCRRVPRASGGDCEGCVRSWEFDSDVGAHQDPSSSLTIPCTAKQPEPDELISYLEEIEPKMRAQAKGLWANAVRMAIDRLRAGQELPVHAALRAFFDAWDRCDDARGPANEIEALRSAWERDALQSSGSES